MAGPKNTSNIHTNTTISDPLISERTTAPPGADYQVVIYDGSLTQTDPGNDAATVTIKTGGARLHRVALTGDVYGVGRLPQLIGAANGAITVSLSAEADIEYTLSYSLRSIVTGQEK